ncbi:helix-turn-helix transcriptional regulator [Methanocella arvoryzae]|uniref:Methanogenesis regulatory protein FilR1 middle domain-containing protein n=1 Tax=Methanocella arvoryzae (strain DSM 22066 / NBRC 105507 / MRE50) TaxID=351160 RepID=Q0W4P8_METAR|nr:winged helix-turn-helix domain-containing protein [Methanocella arvoryzae]CAJ36645.1 conserved hypothetical protein [Methanocella arvoryzae MRE50]
MSECLQKLVLNSEVRKNLVLQLLERPSALTELEEYLNVRPSNLIPQLNKLKSNNLVIKNDGKFRLTSTGSILAKNLRRLDALARLIGKNEQFLNEHDLSPVPESLLHRIEDLGDCTLIENSLENITATFSEVVDKLSKSEKISVISSVFDSRYPELVLSMAGRKVPVSVIVTENIFEVLEKEYADALEAYLEHDNARLYVTDDARLAFAVTDTFTTLSLCKNGAFDVSTSLMSFGPPAIRWGEELFEHYRQKSREIRNP